MRDILLDLNTGVLMADRSFGMDDWTLVTRQLVDAVPADVQAAARHDSCSTYQLQTASAIGCTQTSPAPS